MAYYFGFTVWHGGDVDHQQHEHVLDVEIEGDLDEDGVLLEFGAFKKIVQPIVNLVDKRPLEFLPERCSTAEARAVAEQPTGERLLLWFVARLQLLTSARALPTKLRSVVLREDKRVRFIWP